MDSTDVTYCARHPQTETRLACTQCGTPICPACLVDAPVGQKCPDCARQPKRARVGGRPDQYARAVGFGVGATAVAAIVLSVVFGQIGFLTWILSGVAGYYVAEAVRRGAQGNRADPFRYLAFGLALLAVLGGWSIAARGLYFAPGPYGIVTYLAALYGAYRSMG